MNNQILKRKKTWYYPSHWGKKVLDNISVSEDESLEGFPLVLK